MTQRIFAIFFLGALALSATAVAAQERRLRAGYASLSGNITPLWAAREAGLFKKYGLDIDLIAFPSGTEGMAAMIAGEIEFLAIAGSTTASAAIGGADVLVAALRGGRIQAAILSYPTIIQARREGFREMLDIASLGTPYAANGITLRRSFMQQRRETATNFLKAFLEAIARAKKDKPFAMEVMGKYLRTKDHEVLDETYEFAVGKYLKSRPYPTAEAFRSVVNELAQVNPKAKGQDPKRFYDDTILQELDKSGFINGLYR